MIDQKPEELPPWMTAEAARPESQFAKPIGEFMIAFNWLEHQLELALISLLNVETLDHAYAVLSQLINFEPKIDMFSQLANLLFPDQSQSKIIKDIHDSLDDVNGKRNQLIHGRFSNYVWPPLQLAIIKRRPRDETYKFGNIVFYTTDQVSKMTDEIYKVGLKLGKFKHLTNDHLLKTKRLRASP